MERLAPIDLMFFLTESADSPKHVGGLSIFKLPKGEKRGWVKRFYNDLLTHDDVKPPFNYVINFRALGGPAWKVPEEIDMRAHVFYHGSSKVLSEEAVYARAAALHETLLDRDKPLWEFHIIDNLKGGRFAMYSKIHHAYADGMTLARWLSSWLSDDPEGPRREIIWERADNRARSSAGRRDRQALARQLLRGANQWRQVVTGISKLVTQLALEGAGLTRNAVSIPFKAREETPFSGHVTASRQLASAQVPMERLQKLCATTRCTLNHVALTAVDGALRRYLADHDIELDRPLSIQMPVNLRDRNDEISGNKIGIVLVELAPATDDPYKRLREIGFTLRAVRNQIDGVPPIAVQQYTVVLAVLLELVEVLKLDRFLPAVSDTLVSNVPGPKQVMYMEGARLEQSLPVSTLPPGSQMNITLFSYGGTLYFGLVATDKVTALPSLARYIEEAFVELEDSVYGPDA